MTIVEFKEAILNNTLNDDFLILICEENYFLADRYIEAICHNKNLEKATVSSIFDSRGATDRLFANPTLYVVRVDTFNELAVDYSAFENVIVVCKAVDKKLKASLSDFCITIPKLAEWQVVAYIRNKFPALNDREASWLFGAAGGDIYKIESELTKLSLFEGEDKRQLFDIMHYAPDSDLYSITAFELSKAIIEKNKSKLKTFLYHAKLCDIEPVLLLNVTLATFKKIIYILYSGSNNFEELGLSDKQVWVIKHDYGGGIVSFNYAKHALDFLSGLDLALRTGKLDMSKAQFLDYLICNLLIETDNQNRTVEQYFGLSQ